MPSPTSKKNTSLGKGLGALLGDIEAGNKEIAGSTADSIYNIELDKIIPNHDQPRIKFNEDKLEELAESIKENGVLEPVIVSHHNDEYELIAGERRWRASRIAGLKTIPAVIKNVSKDKRLLIALIENIQREDLSPLEEAISYETLIKKLQLTQDQFAKKIGKSRTYITNILRILKLPVYVKEIINEGVISLGHAKILVGLKEIDLKKTVDKILKNNLTVRQTEKIVKDLHKNDKINVSRETNKLSADPNLIQIENELIHYFQTKVSIKKKPNKGTIEIEFYTWDDLEQLINKMKG